MKTYSERVTLWALVLIPLGLWAAFALPEILATYQSFWDGRNALIVLSGILALWWMSAGMVLAARPAWLERRFGGLDKLYRLHKHLGMGAGLLVLGHWLAEWLPKNLTRLGLLERSARPHGPRPPEDMWLHLAKEVGEWAGYLLMALVVVALIRRIPYRWFRWVHKAFGLLFVAGAYHGLMLLPAAFWQQPLGWLTAALAAAGVVPALLSLSGRIGRSRRVPARIERLHQLDDGVLEVVCRPEMAWSGHRPGQFMFVDFGHAGEGAHPFTIASDWNADEGRLRVLIKSLGDYTGTLATRLSVGQRVVLEGPYGGFTFDQADGSAAPQIWVAGGIGITPFLARMQELARQPAAGGIRAELFYSTRQPPAADEAARLGTLCQAAGVRLHLRATDLQGFLTPEEISSRLVPGTNVWFCGPAAWGRQLAERLTQGGLPAAAFHREAFEFR